MFSLNPIFIEYADAIVKALNRVRVFLLSMNISFLSIPLRPLQEKGTIQNDLTKTIKDVGFLNAKTTET